MKWKVSSLLLVVAVLFSAVAPVSAECIECPRGPDRSIFIPDGYVYQHTREDLSWEIIHGPSVVDSHYGEMWLGDEVSEPSIQVSASSRIEMGKPVIISAEADYGDWFWVSLPDSVTVLDTEGLEDHGNGFWREEGTLPVSLTVVPQFSENFEVDFSVGSYFYNGLISFRTVTFEVWSAPAEPTLTATSTPDPWEFSCAQDGKVTVYALTYSSPGELVPGIGIDVFSVTIGELITQSVTKASGGADIFLPAGEYRLSVDVPVLSVSKVPYGQFDSHYIYNLRVLPEDVPTMTPTVEPTATPWPTGPGLVDPTNTPTSDWTPVEQTPPPTATRRPILTETPMPTATSTPTSTPTNTLKPTTIPWGPWEPEVCWVWLPMVVAR